MRIITLALLGFASVVYGRKFEIGFNTRGPKPTYGTTEGTSTTETTTGMTTTTAKSGKYVVPLFWVKDEKTTGGTTTTTTSTVPPETGSKRYEPYYPWSWWYYVHSNTYELPTEEQIENGDMEGMDVIPGPDPTTEAPCGPYGCLYKATWKPLYQINKMFVTGPPVTTPDPEVSTTPEPTQPPTELEYVVPLFWRKRPNPPAPETTTSEPTTTTDGPTPEPSTQVVYNIVLDKGPYVPIPQKYGKK